MLLPLLLPASPLCAALLQVVQSVDASFIDGCFYSAAELPGRDITQIPHPLITDTAQRLKGVITADHAVVMVHMNHSNPCYRDGPERQQAVEAGLQIGCQGDVYNL
jgi:pyrroloquinoline quinone biosynthesis protein B